MTEDQDYDPISGQPIPPEVEEDEFRPDYFFSTFEETLPGAESKYFVLVIYDITNNKRRRKLAKHMESYGFRVQKSAFEAILAKSKYNKLLRELPRFAKTDESDSIRIYKIRGEGDVTVIGEAVKNCVDDVIII
ncbi:MAG: CRISPR-associated endonuclease Cas2 [Oscillospiraceae bacterium]|jgi:CRISPR-associated protein Cas2|nr:CRISPR-associated endonuclease Cas2 [Oscillospiraceae bacterium]